jgi:lambda family phage tail tape measure protein
VREIRRRIDDIGTASDPRPEVGRQVAQITRQQEAATEGLARARDRLARANAAAARAEEQLVERSQRRTRSDSQVQRNIEERLNRNRAAASAAVDEIGQLNTQLRSLGRQFIAIQRTSAQIAVPEMGRLIDANQLVATQRAIRVLAEEFNRLGDSAQFSAEENRLSRTDLPNQTREFSRLSDQLAQSRARAQALREELVAIGRNESLRRAPASPALGENATVEQIIRAMGEAPNVAEINRENRLIQQRNQERQGRRAEIRGQLREANTEIQQLEAQAVAAGQQVLDLQQRLADLAEFRQQREPRTGLNISLNQIQAQAESLALVANNSRIASAEFNRFTVATEVASVKLARAQQRSFAALAAGLSAEAAGEAPVGLGGPEGRGIEGARQLVYQLAADVPTLTRSEAALSSFLQTAKKVQSLLPYTSNEFRILEEAIAQVSMEMEQIGLRGQRSQISPTAGPARPSGPAVNIGSIRAAQEFFKYEKLVNAEIGKQLSLIDKIDTASIDALEKSNLRQRVERAQLAIDEGRLDVAQRLNVETDRILQKQIKLARPTTQTFGALGTDFMPVSGKLPSGFVAFGSPEEEKQRTEFASKRAEVENKVARVQTEINDILTTQAEKDRLLNQLGLARQEIQQGNLDFADRIAKRTQSDARISRRDFKDRQIQATLLNNALEAGFTEVDRATGSAAKEAEELKKQLDELEQSFGARGQKVEFKADVADFGRRVEDAAAYKRSLQALPGQITELQTIQNNWNKARAKGVKITQEDEQALQNLLGKLRDPGFVVTSATRAQVDEYIKVFRRRTRLRQSESEFSQGGAGAETIERRRSRLLENALNYQRSLSAIEEKGFNLADQRAQLEQKILDIRKAQGTATQADLEILARGLQDIRTGVAEARAAQQAESALTGFPKTLEALKTSLRTSQTYFSGMDPRQAVNEIYKQFNKPNAAIQQQAGDKGVSSVAENVTNTYATTIKSGIPRAAQAMMELGKAGLDAIRKALRMASPSRAMIEIAQNLVDSFVNHLTASGPIIRSTLQSVFEPKIEQRTEYEQMFDRFRADMTGLTRRPRLYGRMLSRLPEEGITTDMVGAANDVYSMRSLPGALEAQIRESYAKKFGKLPLFFEDTFDLILRSFTEFGPALAEALDPRRIAGALKASGRALPPGEGTAEYQQMLSGLKTGMAGLTSNPLYYGGLLSRLPNEAITTGMTGAASDVYGKRRLPASLESEIENAFFREFVRIPSFFEVIVDRIFATVIRLSAASVKPVSVTAVPVRPSLPALPPAREIGDVQALRVERAMRRSQERSAAVLAEDAARRAERTLPDVVGATASVLDSAVDNAQSGQRTLKDAVLKFFSGLASRLTGAGGAGGGGGRPPGGPPGGGPGSLDPDEARRRIAEETRAVAGAEKFPDITKLSLQNLEAFGQALTKLRSQLDPTAEGFNQLEKELRDNLGAIQRRQQQLDPNADFLTRRLDPRLARGVSEGLIGGAFPLLFGQGAGASVLGGLGGFAGGFAGSSLGFGLSLIGTAVGTLIDTLGQKATELGGALNDTSKVFDLVKERGIFSSKEIEKLATRLQEAGLVASASEIAQREVFLKIGADGVENLKRLESASDQMNRQLATLSLQMQAFVAGPLAEFIIKMARGLGLGGEEKRFERLTQQLSPKDAQELNRRVMQGIRASGMESSTRALENTPFDFLLPGRQREAGGRVPLAGEVGRFAQTGKLAPILEEFEARLTFKPQIDEKNLRDTLVSTLNSQISAASGQLEALDITRGIADKAKAAARQREDLEIQRADLVRSLEEGIGSIRKSIEERIQQQRLENVRREGDLQRANGDLLLERVRAANQQFRGTALEEVTGQTTERLLSAVETSVQLQNEAGAAKFDLELKIQSITLENEKFKIETAKQIAKLNEDAARRVADINRGIRRANEDMDGRRFAIEKKLAEIKLKIAEIEVAASVKSAESELIRLRQSAAFTTDAQRRIAEQSELLRLLVAQGTAIKDAQRSLAGQRAPGATSEIGIPGAARAGGLVSTEISTAGIDAAVASAINLERSLAAVQDQISSLRSAENLNSIIMPLQMAVAETAKIFERFSKFGIAQERTSTFRIMLEERNLLEAAVSQYSMLLKEYERLATEVAQAELDQETAFAKGDAMLAESIIARGKGLKARADEVEAVLVRLRKLLGAPGNQFQSISMEQVPQAPPILSFTRDAKIAETERKIFFDLREQYDETEKQLFVLTQRYGELSAVQQAQFQVAASGLHVTDENAKALLAQAEAVDRLTEKLRNVERVGEIANNITSAFAGAFDSIILGTDNLRNILGKFFQDVASAFSKMAAQIIADQLRMLVFNGIMKALGLFVPNPTGFSSSSTLSYFNATTPQFNFNANGNAFASNGIVPFAMGGTFTNSVVSSPTLFKFADGAGLSTGVMGEAGPEAIMPLKRGPGGRLGVEASGAGGGQPVSVVVNVDAKGTGVSGNDQGGNELGRAIAAAVQQELIRQQRPGGILAR